MGVKKDWGTLAFDYGHFTKRVELQESSDGSDTEFQKLDHDKASVKASIPTDLFRYDFSVSFDRADRREFTANDTFDAANPIVNWVQNNMFLDLKAHHAPLGPLQG